MSLGEHNSRTIYEVFSNLINFDSFSSFLISNGISVSGWVFNLMGVLLYRFCSHIWRTAWVLSCLIRERPIYQGYKWSTNTLTVFTQVVEENNQMQRHIAELENVCTKKNDEMGDLRKTMDALNGQIKTAQRDSQDKDKVKKYAQLKF